METKMMISLVNMSFPQLFNSLDLANHGTPLTNQTHDPNRTNQSTPALDGSIIEFEDAYGNTSNEPIILDSLPNTPLVGNTLDAIEIDSTASDETTRDQSRPQGQTVQEENRKNKNDSNKTNQKHKSPNHTAELAQRAPEAYQRQNKQPNQAQEERGGHQWANYSNHYPPQTQQQQAGYHYQPNYPSNLPAPVAQYPPAPSPAYQHQQTPGMSNQLMPPPPPPQQSYQQMRDNEEARLRQAIVDLKRNLDESRVANNNSNFRQILGMAKEAHKELEDFLGGRQHRQKVEQVAGYNPYHLNPKTMEPFKQTRTAGPSSQRRKRARDDKIEELAENASNLLDMILVVKKMKRDNQEPESKGKGKEREQ
ncbi:hypothetical protein DFH28DRAFT_1135862 [Melampsora americana]|nr:hypothetical protein DFH28DRAFT_1135862 [Melampsora americana]